PLPLPRISWGSSFSSVTIRRAAGERTVEDFSAGASLETSFFSAAPSGFLSDFPLLALPSSMVATISPIFTSAPSATRVWSTPSFSALISVETLSVSRVKSGSPALTCSPDFLCQTETTPLEMDSPTAGTFTSMLMKALHYAQSEPTVEQQLQAEGIGNQLRLLALVHRKRSHRRTGARVPA